VQPVGLRRLAKYKDFFVHDQDQDKMFAMLYQFILVQILIEYPTYLLQFIPCIDRRPHVKRAQKNTAVSLPSKPVYGSI